MTETLIIRYFGPIEDVTLDLSKINVFIGDQGTGKSTVAKVITAIELVKTELANNDKNTIDNTHINSINKVTKSLDDIFTDCLIYVGISNYLYDNTEITFDNEFFIFSYKNKEVTLNQKGNEVFDFNNAKYGIKSFIPANRESAQLLGNDLFSLMKTRIQLPYLLTDFGEVLKRAKSVSEIFDFKEVLGVQYEYKNEEDFFIIDNNKKISKIEASSALNSCLPMLLVYNYSMPYWKNQLEKYVWSQEILKKAYLIIIEEPELNCFPETQKKVVQFFMGSLNSYNSVFNDNHKYPTSLIVTTHSPYILTSLNNLMYAYQVGQTHKTEVSKIVPEKYWVNPDDVRCYLMEKEDYKLIMNEEDGLIDASYIDDVSNNLNNHYLRINEIKLKNELGVI